MDAIDIKQWIEAKLPESSVTVKGDGRHFEAVVVCPFFSGKTIVEQHRIVYDALGDKMQSEIHALSLQTLTPEQVPPEPEEDE